MGKHDVFFKKCHRVALGSPQTMENNEFLWKYVHHCNALDSPNCFVWSTMPQKIYSEDYWFSNMVSMVNHAMEDLQHRILYFSKYCLLYIAMWKWKEQGKERKDSDGKVNSTERDKRETEEYGQSRLARWREYDRHKL